MRLPLPGASSSDFAGSTKNIAPGYEGAMEKAGALRGLALSAGQFERYRGAQRVPRETTLRISFLEYPGANGPLRKDLETADSFRAGRSHRTLAVGKGIGVASKVSTIPRSRISASMEASGEYGLQIETRAKSRGPNYVNLGFDFDYTSAGETDADILLALRDDGVESARRGVGDVPQYRRFDARLLGVVSAGRSARRFFLAANVLYSNEFINALDGTDQRFGFRLQNALGGRGCRACGWGRSGELRLGYSGGASRIGRALNLPPNSDRLVGARANCARRSRSTRSIARIFRRADFLRARWRTVSREELGARANYSRLDAQLYKPITFGKNTIVPRIVAGVNLSGNDLPLYDRVLAGRFSPALGIFAARPLRSKRGRGGADLLSRAGEAAGGFWRRSLCGRFARSGRCLERVG